MIAQLAYEAQFFVEYSITNESSQNLKGSTLEPFQVSQVTAINVTVNGILNSLLVEIDLKPGYLICLGREILVAYDLHYKQMTAWGWLSMYYRYII